MNCTILFLVFAFQSTPLFTPIRIILILKFDPPFKSFFQPFVEDKNLPADVTLVLSHAKVSLHMISGISQLSSGKLADLTHEGLGSWKAKYGESKS